MGLLSRFVRSFQDNPALRTASVYALFAGIWIVASDAVLGMLFRDPETLTRLATLKGWAFVAVTASMLYGLVHRDVASLQRTEKELRHALQIQSLILDNSSVGIAFVRHRRFEWANPRLAELLGTSPAELQGKSTRLIYASDEAFQAFGTQAYAALARGDWHDAETTLYRQDGTTFTGRLLGKALDPPQPQEGSVWIFEDVTERRRSDEALRQAQKLEALGQLAGGVAHDTNNMLGVIIGYVDLLLDAVPERNRGDLEQIRKAAMNSADLTRQLLAFARKQSIQPVAADLNTVVGGMQKMLRRLIGEQHTLEWKPGIPVWPVWVDPSQVDQILANLVVNARDALGPGGRITIETANVQVDEAYLQFHPDASLGDFVVLAVTDTGHGMTPEVQARIFDPFFTTKAAGHGTGLGLATVYGIVRQNGGFLSVYSDVGVGTTFRVHLPRHRGEGTPAAAPTREPRGGTETILLVEDEVSLLDLTQRLLEAAGYRVLPASHPEEALRIAQTHADGIALLATDLVMPGLNGRELFETLQATRPDLRVLFLSGYSAATVSLEALSQQGAGFLQKPFTRPGLLEKVRQVLED